MNITQTITNAASVLRQASERVFAPSNAEPKGPTLGDAFNNHNGGMMFTKLSDFLRYYKSDAFNIAYNQLDPFSCYVLAFSNDRIMSAVTAIARPIAASEFIASPKDKEHPNKFEIQQLNDLLHDPNPDLSTPLGTYDYNVNTITEYDQSSTEFQYKSALDLIITGNNYIEVSYNRFGKIAAQYRHPPYMIDIKDGRYVHKNGYVFKSGELIHNKYMNPFSNKVGMSPLVPLVAATMLDGSILQKNIQNFANDALKGIISIDPSLDKDKAEFALNKLKANIKEMKKKGESGHLVTFAAAFQAISTTNKDMLTPELEMGIAKRIIGIFGVPPAEIGLFEGSGGLSIGTDAGQSMKETLYESVKFWNKFALFDGYKRKLTRYGGFIDTTVDIKNLNIVDEKKQAELHEKYLNNGVTDIDEVRTDLGKEPYGEDWSKTPTIASSRIPANAIGQQGFMQSSNPGSNTQQVINSLKKFEQTLDEILN